VKIAFVGPKGIPATFGGIEAHVEALATHLASRNHSVTVYVRSWYTPRDLRQYNGIRLRHLPTIHTKHLDASMHSFVSSLSLLFEDVDIVHYHAIGPAFFCWLPALLRKKIVVTVHALDWQRAKWGPLVKTMLRVGERIAMTVPSETIVVSRHLRSYFAAKYHKQVTYIPNGTELQKREALDIIAKKYHLKVNSYILFMGRFVPEKRIEWLIDAFKAVNADRPKQRFKLVLAGGSSATDKYVKQLQSRVGGSDNVVFTGFVTGKEKAELFSNASSFVLPSSVEGSPIALLEAMSFGIPCLASDIPPHQEIITDGVNGILFKCNHFGDLVYRLKFILAENPVRLKKLGEEGEAFVRQKHNWNIIARQTEEVYYSVASGP
jgi:glycosyltransferase involved in cell wall biosynthesis